MKTKMLLTLTSSLFCSLLFAQNTTVTTTTAGGTTIGVKAGVNFQNLTGKDVNGNRLKSYQVTPGFMAGVDVNVPIGTDTYLQPGVLYSLKGAQSKLNSENKIRLSYIEVPVNFVYKPLLGTGHMLLGFGPYAAWGIGGKAKYADGSDQKIVFTNTHTTNSVPQFKRFDAGGNLLAGYEWSNGISAGLNAQLGLVNIQPDYEGTVQPLHDIKSLKNTGFGVSVGYSF